MELRRLHPRPLTTTPEDLIGGLDLGSRAPQGRPYVIANMVATIDGRAAVDGTTEGLGGEADQRIFHNLRTQVDAILVGASTARTEGYGRPARSDALCDKRAAEGLDPRPWSVIVSGRLNLDASVPVLADPEARVIVATAADGEIEDVRSEIVYERTGDDLPLLLARLYSEHGIRSVLCEGGPTLNAHMLAAGLIDELFLSTAPQISAGEAPTIVTGRELMSPTRAELIWLHESEGALFARWRLRP